MVWPNPSEYLFNLEIKEVIVNPFTISIYDIGGRLVQQDLDIYKNSYSFGQLFNPGMYFVSIKIGDETRIIRIIKY